MSTEILYNSRPVSSQRSEPLSKGVHLNQVQTRLGRSVLASAWPKTSVDYAKSMGTNAFLEAVHLAYVHRLPLTLSPGMVWSCIQQGVGLHVRASHKQIVNTRFTNPDVWRERLYVEGGGESWDETVCDLSEAASERIREAFKDNLLPSFSITETLEKLCMKTSLANPLSTAKKCLLAAGREGGLVEIALEGTTDDWTSLHDHTIQLLKDIHYDIDWWVDTVLPILDQFVSASSGSVDNAFWSRMYKTTRPPYGDDPFVHGWINVLFPYLEITEGEYVVNDWPYRLSEQKVWEAPVSVRYPSGLTTVPFSLDPCLSGRQYSLISGFVGVSRDRHTRGIRPRLGWVVVDDTLHGPPITNHTSQNGPPTFDHTSRNGLEESDV